MSIESTRLDGGPLRGPQSQSHTRHGLVWTASVDPTTMFDEFTVTTATLATLPAALDVKLR